jgi:hypothetical protein
MNAESHSDIPLNQEISSLPDQTLVATIQPDLHQAIAHSQQLVVFA